jgi:magnesium transporter
VITTRVYRDGRPTEERCEPKTAAAVASEPGSFVWLDAADPDASDVEVLASAFRLHPLTVEDIRQRGQRPKVEVFDDYTFAALRPMGESSDGMAEGEIHAILGVGYLITLRAGGTFDMTPVVRRWESHPREVGTGAGFAFYVLADEVIDGYLSLVEAFEDRADDLEDRVFAEAAPQSDGLQEELFRLKRDVVHLRRAAAPLRQSIDLVQERGDLVGAGLGPYFRDVTEHVIRVAEFCDNVRDLLTSLLEIRVGQAANRLNEVTKRISSWGAIILVPTLVAGIYGMNFRHMPELHWRYGYLFAWGLILATGVGLYVYFKRKDFL